MNIHTLGKGNGLTVAAGFHQDRINALKVSDIHTRLNGSHW
jgi:hypothetical protein